VIHAGRFRNVQEMAGRDVLVVGRGNSGVDLLGHLACSDAGGLWLAARSGMNTTPLRLGGVPLHPVSVMGRYLPLRWQDANARVVQRLAFGDLTRLGYPRSALGAFTRAAADVVTVAVDDGFVRALKDGRVTMKPPIDRFDGPQVCFTDGTNCAPDAIICATGYRPGLEQVAGHLVTLDAHGMSAFTGARSPPQHPGLWFFGLDRSIYGNMHVRRRQARQLAQATDGNRGRENAASEQLTNPEEAHCPPDSSRRVFVHLLSLKRRGLRAAECWRRPICPT
jgi:hypothetical protein